MDYQSKYENTEIQHADLNNNTGPNNNTGANINTGADINTA